MGVGEWVKEVMLVGLGLWRGREKSRKKCGLEKEKKVDVNSMK